jgi:hypothetical protein
VSATPEEIEIAEAAWRILQNTGGLMDRSDIQQRFGQTRQRAFALSKQRHFPDPIGTVGGRPVWLALHVERYHAQPPPTGRPPKAKAPDG